MLDDKQFLQWIYERLACVHKENTAFDYMHRLRAIVELMPEGRCSKANGCITKNGEQYNDLVAGIKELHKAIEEGDPEQIASLSINLNRLVMEEK